jgi:hypothetical protein
VQSALFGSPDAIIKTLVDDSADEDSYLPLMEGTGYVLREMFTFMFYLSALPFAPITAVQAPIMRGCDRKRTQ